MSDARGRGLTTRQVLGAGAAFAATGGTSLGPAIAQGAAGPFTVPPLRFPADALAPSIDAETMRLHHDRHHQAYVDALNAVLAPYPVLGARPIEALLGRLDDVPAAIRQTVRDQGGGHANHAMFWQILGPSRGGPSGALADRIAADFGSLDGLKARFKAAATGQFGSGWVFLTAEPPTGRLGVTAFPNQDSPLLGGRPALMGCDVWEHAYYVSYRNRRADYVDAFWNVVDWPVLAERFAALRDGRTLL